jgi:hypothetical protein
MKKGHTLGIILILIGAAWIIRQAGVISVNWAASVKTLWPVFLVAAGATIMLGQKKKLVTGIWILTFVVFIGFGISKRNEPARIIDFEENLQIDVGPLTEVRKTAPEKEIQLSQGTGEGRLILQLGAAKVNLSGKGSDVLVRLDSNIPGLRQRLSNGKQAVLEYSHEQSNRKVNPHFQLEMNPDIKWDIEANLGVVDGTLNLEEVAVRQMDLRLGVGEMEIRFGQRQEITKMNLWSGATKLDIYIPKDAGLKIKSGKLISALDVHNLNMNEQDGFQISDNYDTAKQKIEIEIVSAMSEIEVFVQ